MSDDLQFPPMPESEEPPPPGPIPTITYERPKLPPSHDLRVIGQGVPINSFVCVNVSCVQKDVVCLNYFQAARDHANGVKCGACGEVMEDRPAP